MKNWLCDQRFGFYFSVINFSVISAFFVNRQAS
jgi:hypothetical protein